MKQENVFKPVVLKGSAVRPSFQIISTILLAILVTIILAFSINMFVFASVPGGATELVIAESRPFPAVNPETRYVQPSVGLNFLAANPETRYAHLDPASLIKVSKRAFLAINPETRYVAQPVVRSFLATNPETRHTQAIPSKTAQRDSLAVNPETKYMENDLNGSGDLFEANPELMFHQRYLVEKNSK